MHEELFAELQRVIPRPEWTFEGSFPPPKHHSRHVRWKSVDLARPNQFACRAAAFANRRSVDAPRCPEVSEGIMADTQTTMEVAKVFNSFVRWNVLTLAPAYRT
jgi:hypothetical protein